LCFFLRNRVDLPPGGRATVHYATGTSDAPQSVAPIADLLKDDSRIEALLQEVKDEYADLTSTLTIQTGRPKLDAIMNIWIKKQMRSYLAFKNAYRDNLQIDMAYSLVDADRAVDNALDVLSFQYLDGHVPHSCRPLNPTHYSDKPAWLLMAWPELIKETGDVSLLERPVPYLREDGRKTREGKPVWEHLIRTMRHLELDTGPHGINLMHHADWNDGLDSLSGAGESTLTSLFFCAGLQEMEALARRIGESRIADEARDIYERLAERINTVCWDGRWYNRGFAPDGRSLGSHEREEGKIFLNPQVWAVISGVADPDRAAAVLQQADEKLETDLGMKLVDPSFSRYDPDVGSMSANPPGIAENGVYLHASAFKLVADCLAGRPDAAWRLMNKLLPDAAQNPLAQSRGLPFAVTNSYRAAESLYGLAGSPWRTGTAGWVYRAMIQYILGIRRGYDGLSVAPCLPKQLSDVRVSRAFRGVTYDIHLDNHSGNGVHAKRIEVDGKAVKGNALPLEQGVEQYTVEVVL
jgi:cellobiose phosphorylase